MNDETRDKRICICLATDARYLHYCWNTICSIMQVSTNEEYEFIVLESDLPQESINTIQENIKKWPNAFIRFIDVTSFSSILPSTVRAYYSAVTYYRALLFSNLFEKYDKILYLDSDITVNSNISELYFTDIEGYAVAAVKDYTMDAKMLFDIPIDYQGVRHSAQNYICSALKINEFDSYFNAGVILFNLQECRRLWSFEQVIDVFQKENYFLQDQDALNILLEGHIKYLETKWNYQNVYELLQEESSMGGKILWNKVRQSDIGIIHYVSSNKPWNSDECIMKEYYKSFPM